MSHNEKLDFSSRCVHSGIKENEFTDKTIDVTEIFEATKCHLIKNALKNGCKVKAVVLPKLSGILGIEEGVS